MKPQEQKPNIATTIFPEIKKTINYWAVITAFLMVDIGVGSMFISQYIIGATIIVVGIILLIVKYKSAIYEKTGSPVKTYSHFIQKDKIDQLYTSLAEKNFQDAKPVKIETDGNAKIEYIMSDDKKFVAVQLLEYIPFAYEPYTPVYNFTDEKATEFANFIDKCKAQK